MSKTVPLLPANYYHIFNRGNNRENLFLEQRNYHYLLRLYEKYISPVAVTLAYCLMPNHFHFLVMIADQPSSPPSQAFANLFSTYAKAINRGYQRTGSLFQKPFRRVLVTSAAQFTRLILYIHRNPQKHGFVDDLRDWPHSSYQVIRHGLHSADQPRLARTAILDWFGGVAGFETAHRQDRIHRQVVQLISELSD